MMDVSVIIVNYNTCQMTSECIDSIFKKTSGIQFEVIVVDNGSTDESKEFFEKDDRIKYIYSDINLGFGRANNVGSRLAKGEYLFLLNSDTLLIENSIFTLFNYMSSQDEFVACGTQLKYPNGIFQQSEIYFPTIKHDLLEIMPATIRNKFIVNRDTEYKITEVKTAEIVNGANIFVKKNAFEELGGFDEDFFMYYEETDLFFRLKNEGYKSCIIPYTEIIHYNGGSFKKKFSSSKSLIQYRSKILYYKKHYSSLMVQLVRLILSICVLVRISSFRKNIKNTFKAIWL